MADPAPTQILAAIGALVARTGVTVFIDADESDAIQPRDWPAIAISFTGGPLDEASESGESVIRWRSTIELDHYAGSEEGEVLNAATRQLASDSWALIAADTTHLGNLASAVTPVEMTADPERVPDVGVTKLAIEVWFDTAFNDFTRIIF